MSKDTWWGITLLLSIAILIAVFLLDGLVALATALPILGIFLISRKLDDKRSDDLSDSLLDIRDMAIDKLEGIETEISAIGNIAAQDHQDRSNDRLLKGTKF